MDKQLFRDSSQNFLVYIANTTITDPYEKTTSLSYLNSIPIQAVVADLSAGRAVYKMNGILTDKAKEIIVEKKYRALLEMSYKLQVLGEDDLYQGWEVSGKMQIFELDNEYIRLYIYIKQISD